jgi:uracil-DNA glycosylase
LFYAWWLRLFPVPRYLDDFRAADALCIFVSGVESRGMTDLDRLLADIRACHVCEASLPLGPRPTVRASETARIMIVGQAPGTRVHETGIPWNDRSGDRLRAWLGLDRETFYDESRIAIVPMGFCYPGVDRNGGDAPPRPECAPLWHARLRSLMPNVALTVLAGSYGQAGMTETVARWRDYLPEFFPAPHPSWRNTAWLKRNPWFEDEALPALRHRLHALL